MLIEVNVSRPYKDGWNVVVVQEAPAWCYNIYSSLSLRRENGMKYIFCSISEEDSTLRMWLQLKPQIFLLDIMMITTSFHLKVKEKKICKNMDGKWVLDINQKWKYFCWPVISQISSNTYMDDYVKADSGLVQEFKPVISFFYWQDQENSGQHRVIVRDDRAFNRWRVGEKLDKKVF